MIALNPCILQVLGSEVSTDKEREHWDLLKALVIGADVMVDKLVLRDVQLTAANDDNYFVFEDAVIQVLLAFTRDTEVVGKFNSRLEIWKFRALIYSRAEALNCCKRIKWMKCIYGVFLV